VIWVGGSRGLWYKKKDDLNLIHFTNELEWGLLNNVIVLGIYDDNSGNLWVGTAGHGIFCSKFENRKSNTFIHYTHDPGDPLSLSNDWVWSFYEDQEDNLWIATHDGLNKFLPEKDGFDHFYHPNDPAANFIYDVTGDDKGMLWLMTEGGLIRFDPLIDAENDVAGNQYKQVRPFKNLFPYKIFSSKSRMIFLGSAINSGEAFYYFHPDSLKENKHIPAISITDFQVRNEPVKLDSNISYKKHIRLKFNQNFFSLGFAALDYAQPGKNQYAYYLEGLEDDWIYSGTKRIANYTGVPPGNYVFHAKGSNNDGYWNERGVSVAITILPPPWRTWWAYMGYILILIGLIILWRVYDLRRIRLKQALELEQVEAEKLKELDSLKSSFFANISHEFRTPLTLILGPLEKIRSLVSSEVKQELDIMKRNAQRLKRLIDQLLTLSKLESGELKLKAKQENIVPLVNGYVQSFESLAKQKNIDLVFDTEEKEVLVYVDQDKLEKILFNLLSNAFKFTPANGGIKISIIKQESSVFSRQSSVKNVKSTEDWRLKTEDLPENCTVISISDTGSGIPPNHLAHIFDRFYQADDSDTQLQEGTGIGLALTKELVELHHGKVEVESEVGSGTTFRVYLPLGEGHLSPEELDTSRQSLVVSRQSEVEYETWTPQPPKGGVIKKKSPLGDLGVNRELRTDQPLLLIVEDNTDLRQYIRSYLDEEFNIIEAENGAEGLDKAIENIPDLVISDVMMPMMDGLEFCSKLKKDERTSHIPVILLTAKAGSESKIEGLETGADDFLTKPFDAKELIVRIKNLVSQRKTLRELYSKEILFGIQEQDQEIPSMDQKFIRKAKQVVEDNLTVTDFTSEDFAKEMALSRVQLHRKLTALVDQSASAFIRTIRLNKAAELLSNNAGTVKEIAFDVGFNTLPYFTKCFREQFGVNPSEYPPRNSGE
jgi:signal transduction histidine kinase/DNA-binding response OmpR family regulator